MHSNYDLATLSQALPYIETTDEFMKFGDASFGRIGGMGLNSDPLSKSALPAQQSHLLSPCWESDSNLSASPISSCFLSPSPRLDSSYLGPPVNWESDSNATTSPLSSHFSTPSLHEFPLGDTPDLGYRNTFPEEHGWSTSHDLQLPNPICPPPDPRKASLAPLGSAYSLPPTDISYDDFGDLNDTLFLSSEFQDACQAMDVDSWVNNGSALFSSVASLSEPLPSWPSLRPSLHPEGNEEYADSQMPSCLRDPPGTRRPRRNPSSLTRRRKERIGVYHCPEVNCQKQFTRERDVVRHLRSVHKSDDNQPIICPDPGCKKSFSRKDALQRHNRTKHTDIG